MFGLSKERPILGDHPKAHIHEIRQISGEIWRISGGFHVKSARFCVDFTWNPPDFVRISPAEIRRISWNPADFERPIARNGKPNVYFSGKRWYTYKYTKTKKPVLKCQCVELA